MDQWDEWLGIISFVDFDPFFRFHFKFPLGLMESVIQIFMPSVCARSIDAMVHEVVSDRSRIMGDH